MQPRCHRSRSLAPDSVAGVVEQATPPVLRTLAEGVHRMAPAVVLERRSVEVLVPIQVVVDNQ